MNRAVFRMKARLLVCFRKQVLAALLRATAQALGAPVPSIARLSADECLRRYALFTQDRVAAAIQNGDDLDALQDRLYRNAYRLGRACRWVFRPRSVADAMALGRILYRLLDIEFQGDADDNAVVSRCYFSRFYSGQVCRVMSAADRGMFAGLSNGGQLVFSTRITEGQAQCRAHLSAPGVFVRNSTGEG
ncbi:MAG: hypothetical protein JW934_04090 [Anaerolineae bacterium]|nr:hypothetical protein [Anaerolineae bacterium]